MLPLAVAIRIPRDARKSNSRRLIVKYHLAEMTKTTPLEPQESYREYAFTEKYGTGVRRDLLSYKRQIDRVV